MEETNKHNIFSKEELFKLIDEKKSLPPETDDFDKEAFEGLAMVTNREKLETLNESIDEVLRREARKAGKKRNMYYFAAAASLLLVIGLFFLMKENAFEKKDSGLAVNNPVNTNQAPVAKGEQMETSGKEDKEPSADFKTTTEEVTTKEVLKERKLNDEVAAKNQETFATDVTTVNVPPAESANKLTLAANEKSNNGNEAGGVKLDATLEEKKSGGKAGKDDKYVDTDEEQKREQYKKEEDKKLSKVKEDEKEKHVRYETNTVWTTPATSDNKDKQVVDELKQKTQPQTESKPGTGTTDDNRNNQNANVTTTNAPVQTQSQGDVVTGGGSADQSKVAAPKKNAEVVVSAEQKVNQGPFSKKYRAKKARVEKSPDTGSAPAGKAAGYAYYSQSSTRSFTSPEFIGGDEALQKFVKENLKISSPDKTGTIVAEFLVKKDGSIDAGSIKVIIPLKNCDSCSKDVIELIKSMPQWKPATENGQGKEYSQKLSVLYDIKMSKK
ncbi:MAG TPA: hypothetical protein VNZ49_11720 [Bacteroidia bacterium]|jgi:hypothetical protein|nr:hypothetical protein [Bacteroidia bacterium]